LSIRSLTTSVPLTSHPLGRGRVYPRSPSAALVTAVSVAALSVSNDGLATNAAVTSVAVSVVGARERSVAVTAAAGTWCHGVAMVAGAVAGHAQHSPTTSGENKRFLFMMQ